MRFGIMAMQLGALIPPGLAPEQMMATSPGSTTPHWCGLHSRGFNPVEFGGDLVMFLPHAYGRRPSSDWLRSKPRPA